MPAHLKAHRVIAVAAGTVLALNPATAVAAPPAAVEQGGAFTNLTATCTLGYNDVEAGISYTAAHCGTYGERVYLLNRVTDEINWGAGGTFYPSSEYDGYFSNDWGVIIWDSGVPVRHNRYSGDQVVHPSELSQGDPVCYHGETSHTGTTDYDCHPFHNHIHNTFSVRNMTWQGGDSGGPLWVPGKGFVGVISSGQASEFLDLGEMVLQVIPTGWGVFPDDGPIISDDEFFSVFLDASGVTEAPFPDFDPGQDLPYPPVTPVPADGGSSAASTAVAVLGVLAALTAIIAVIGPVLAQNAHLLPAYSA